MEEENQSDSKKSGHNINSFINIENVTNNFISYYFDKITKNKIQELINDKVLRDYTTIKFNNDKIKCVKLIEFLNRFINYNINITHYNFIDSGSRRIDITVIGTMKKQTEETNFNQTFTICNHENTWYIKNSIFVTF